MRWVSKRILKVASKNAEVVISLISKWNLPRFVVFRPSNISLDFFGSIFLMIISKGVITMNCSYNWLEKKLPPNIVIIS